MKRQRTPRELREPREELKRPSKRDEELDDAKELMRPKSKFETMRRDHLSRNFKK